MAFHDDCHYTYFLMTYELLCMLKDMNKYYHVYFMIMYLKTKILTHPSKIFLHHLPNAILKHRTIKVCTHTLPTSKKIMHYVMFKKLIQGGNTQPV